MASKEVRFLSSDSGKQLYFTDTMFFSNTSMVSLPSKWFSSNNNSSIFDGPLKILGSLCSVLWLSCVKQPYNPYFSETQVSHFLLVPQLCCCSVAECVAMGCTCKQETAELSPQPTQRLTDLCVQAARAVHTAGMLQVSDRWRDLPESVEGSKTQD